MVRAMKSIDEPSLPLSVYGPTRSTQRASHGVLITILDGRCPYFCVCYSLGKSCMISFWIGWSLHSFPVNCRFHCLFEMGMPRVLKIVVIPHDCMIRASAIRASFVSYATFIFYKKMF